MREINWDYVGDAVPAFLTLLVIPLTYNIAFGVIAGVLSYVILNGGAWLVKKLTCGAIVPPNYDLAERWVVPPGGIVPGWVRVLAGRPAPHEEVRMEQRREAETPSLEEQMHQKSFTTSDDVKR